MKIENKTYRFNANADGKWLGRIAPLLRAALGEDTCPLRFSIVDVSGRDLVIEATVVRFDANSKYAGKLGFAEFLEPRRKPFQAEPFGVVQIIPTGIRCEFGGYAGDASPSPICWRPSPIFWSRIRTRSTLPS